MFGKEYHNYLSHFYEKGTPAKELPPVKEKDMYEKDFLDCVNFIYEQMCSWIEEDDIESLKQEVYGLGKLLMEYKADTNK